MDITHVLLGTILSGMLLAQTIVATRALRDIETGLERIMGSLERISLTLRHIHRHDHGLGSHAHPEEPGL